MLIFKVDNKVHCFIHCPKNSGKFIQKKIIEKFKDNILFWGEDIETTNLFQYPSYIDRAHIPIHIFEEYFYKDKIDHYHAFTRNPFDRVLSAYKYRSSIDKNLNPGISGFRNFCKNTLAKMGNLEFRNVREYFFTTHFLPQFIFVEGLFDNGKFDERLSIYKLEEYEMWKNDFLFELKGFKNIKRYHYNIPYFDETTINIIQNLYNIDFKIFKYCTKF